jgi:NAD/NADP transhydrogenase beta subunit
MNNKILTVAGIIVGVLGLVLAYIYWTTPSGSLPSYFPGFMMGGTTVHIKHGVAALVLGLVAFAVAWFSSGKKN